MTEERIIYIWIGAILGAVLVIFFFSIKSKQIGSDQLLLLANAYVISLNCYLLYKINKDIKKLNKYNVTGRACELARLGELIPLNIMFAIINFMYVIFKTL